MLPDTNSNVSLSIVPARTNNNFLSSGLGMDINITLDKIRKILTRRLSRHIGTRASGLARCRQGMLGTGTAYSYEFLYLDFGFRNWFGFCIGILGFPHFFCFGLVPKFSLSLAMNHVLLCMYCDWVFICLSLLYCCFEIAGLSF